MFIIARSEARTETLSIVDRLAGTNRYRLATIINESLKLYLYRIQQFRLREYFAAFFSSCFLGVRKPDKAIYRMALEVTQCPPQECLFIDDRAVNLESARHLGMRTVHYHGPSQLREELQRNGVEIESGQR